MDEVMRYWDAMLVEGGLEGAIREIKAARDGEIEVAGPNLAQSLTDLGLIDEPPLRLSRTIGLARM